MISPEAPLSSIKGVGPKTYQNLVDAGLSTVSDLLQFWPRSHEDFRDITTIASIRPGNVTLCGAFSHVSCRPARRGMTITTATLTDSTGSLPVTWFNQPYREKQISGIEKWLVAGKFDIQSGKYQLINPSVEHLHRANISTSRIVPVYSAIKGLKSQLVRKLLLEIEPIIYALPETLPVEIIDQFHLCTYAEAVAGMHFPKSPDDIERSRLRLGFEEVYAMMLASLRNKSAQEKLPAWPIGFDNITAKQFVSMLPFSLTDDQRISAWEILQDMTRDKPMNRMLQGDVGSGKTVVAGMAAYMASRAGYQTAFMAPTELLAAQHAETLHKLLDTRHANIALLTGSVKAKAKNTILQRLSEGNIDIVVGTHALIQDSVKFHRLGLAVIDEQHRFGVAQRQALLSKSERMPHLLSMTATPIPRSLQLTIYGELEISILKTKPSGRLPIKTDIISPNSRSQLYTEVDRQIAHGRQVYVVCPLINESEIDDIRNVEQEINRLKASPFRHRRLGMLHGQMSPEDKQSVMQQFASQQIDILVSTTVVEVGVDVPNATVIIIEGADKFGLAQLHQLRGRVGRSEHQSFCYLIPSTSRKPSQRLREIQRSNDGFYLAERDLEMRGPGEIYGRAQHGALRLSIARLSDAHLLRAARKAAEMTIEMQIDLSEFPQLQDSVYQAQRTTQLN